MPAGWTHRIHSARRARWHRASGGFPGEGRFREGGENPGKTPQFYEIAVRTNEAKANFTYIGASKSHDSEEGGNSSPSLTSTVTWSLTLLSICACWCVGSTWRRLAKASSAGEPGRRPPSSGPRVTRSGLHIVYRCGSAITSNSGSPELWPSSKPKKEFIPSRPK